jgi:hypothetical protein
MGNEDADHGVEVLDRAEGAAVDGLPLRIGTVQAGLSSSLSTINAQLPDSRTFPAGVHRCFHLINVGNYWGRLGTGETAEVGTKAQLDLVRVDRVDLNHLMQNGQASPESRQRRCRQCRRSVSPSNDAGHPTTVLATVAGPGQDGLDGSAPPPGRG